MEVSTRFAYADAQAIVLAALTIDMGVAVTGLDVWVSFQGTNFGNGVSGVTITFGPSNECFLDGNKDFDGPPGSVTNTAIKCRITGRLSVGTYPLSVSVGGQVVVSATNKIVIPEPPTPSMRCVGVCRTGPLDLTMAVFLCSPCGWMHH